VTGKRIPKQTRGRPISAKNINAAAPWIERLTRGRGAPGSIWLPGGPMQAMPGIILRPGMTDQSGIPARETAGRKLLGYSATVSEVAWEYFGPGRVTYNEYTSTMFDGYNLSQQPVAGTTLCLFAYILDVWICIWEDCPSGTEQ
jgi:hypothetical protein